MKDLVIKTRHFRRHFVPMESPPFFKIKMSPMSEIRRYNIDRRLLLARGGKTQVAIYDQDGNKLSEAEAICGKSDHFNRKVGRTAALGRAIKKMNSIMTHNHKLVETQ